MKKTDLFYRYIPADIVRIVLDFTFLGITTLIVYKTKETDFFVQLIGSKMLYEGIVLSTLAIIFYTVWAIYCNDFSSKKGRFKYIVIIIAIIAVTVFIIVSG